MSLFDSRSLAAARRLARGVRHQGCVQIRERIRLHTHAVAAAKPHQMTVVATDYKFDAPDEVPSGMMTIHLVDNGAEMHHVAFVKLNDGKTVADIEQAMKTQGPMPSWAVDYGGVNPPHPGRRHGHDHARCSSRGTTRSLCFVPSADGTPHFAKGMVRPLTVTASSDASAPAPVADIDMTLNDYSFTTSKPITAGSTRSRSRTMPRSHTRCVLARLAPGQEGRGPSGVGREAGGTTARRADRRRACHGEGCNGVRDRRFHTRATTRSCAFFRMRRTASRTSRTAWSSRCTSSSRNAHRVARIDCARPKAPRAAATSLLVTAARR